jgi:hypothetical protein
MPVPWQPVALVGFSPYTLRVPVKKPSIDGLLWQFAG